MLIIKVEPGESVDKAVKRYKKKYQNTKMLNEIRGRKNFIKPSVKRREQLIKARYQNELGKY